MLCNYQDQPKQWSLQVCKAVLLSPDGTGPSRDAMYSDLDLEQLDSH